MDDGQVLVTMRDAIIASLEELIPLEEVIEDM